MKLPDNPFQTKRLKWSDEVEDQSRKSRISRLEEGKCPLHGKPLLQSDVWYRPRSGNRYTFVSCMHPKCRLEAICNETYDKFTLIPCWRFLLDQNDEGQADILQLRNSNET